MEFLIAIGSGVVVKIAEYTVEPVGRQFGYITSCKSNLRLLESQVKDLDAARESVQHKVAEEERRGRKVETYVNKWLSDVDKITGEANNFLKDEQQQQKMKCLYGFCPNLMFRYQLSRKSTKLVKLVVEVYGKRSFPSISYKVPPQEVCSLSTKAYEAFDSRISIVKKIMDELRNPSTDSIGVYGIGGVGKTTLVKEVFRQATKERLFDDVVMVLDVKQNSNLERIQREVAEKLGLDILDSQTIPGRARNICDRIKDKKTLVILDDIWETIDLEAVGLPSVATCKILLTSRSRTTLSSGMRTQKEFPIDVLESEETWRLFEKIACDVVKDPAIRAVATKVAEKCGGLPVLVVTVASALKNRSTLHAWKDALRRLKRFDKEELTEKAYLGLEWSYSQLDDKELKPLFLLCGISVSGNCIYLADLLKYSMGLRLFENVDTLEEARDALHALVDKLKDSCLLLDGDDNTSVRMHDLVRDVAISIASKNQHVLSVASAGELKEWPDKDFFKKCSVISFHCCSIPRFPEVLQCPQLKMFILDSNDDYLLKIPCNFFEEMKKLKVMDLTKLRIPTLPPSLQFLINLQTLCLDLCVLGDIALIGQLGSLEILSFIKSTIEWLPKEIGQLTRLRLLDLTGCSKLQVIAPNVLSSLKRLEDLRMRNSFNRWEAEGVTGERNNASLLELKHLSQLTALEIHIPDANILPADLFSGKDLERYQIFIGDAWEWRFVDESTLNTLKLQLASSNQLDQGLKELLKRSEDLYLDGMGVLNNAVYQSDSEGFQQLKHLNVQNNAEFTNIINGKVVLPNLTTLSMHGCHGFKFLLSSSMARSLVQLKHLEVSRCHSMEEIVSTREYGERNMDYMFRKLEDMKLKELPNLARFCSGSYIELPSLEKLDFEYCPKVGAFISDPKSKSTQICKKIKQRGSMENLDVETALHYFLFDEKVRFPRLEVLVIDGLSKLTTIWHNQLAPDSFCRIREVQVIECQSLMNIFAPGMVGRLKALSTLKIDACNSLRVVFELGGTHSTTQLNVFYCQNLDSVDIHMCQGLKNIFPSSVAKGLQQLQKLQVSNCEAVEEIVSREEGLEATPKWLFPKVTYVELRYLPLLRSFYLGMHTSEWPLLKELQVFECNNVEIFASEFSTFEEKLGTDRLCTTIKRPLFLIEKDSFPKLEQLTLGAMKIWYGSSPSEFFCKLNSVHFYHAPFSKKAAIFLQKLHNLEKLEVSCAPCKKIFVHGGKSGNDNGEVHAAGTLPLVRYLSLDKMCKLMHLGKEKSQPGSPIFPNLEILEVMGCDRLKHLKSSAISFRNLTTLQVIRCHGLNYLTTYLVAKSLVQLTQLTVEDCKRMIEIVASNGDHDAGDEIAFSRLQHMTLRSLPSLQGFCSESCNVKFPSLETLSINNRLKLKIFPDI